MERFCTPYAQFLFKVTSCITRGQYHNKEVDIDTLYPCWSYPDFSKVNCELPDVQACFRKGRGTRDQMAIIHWIVEKAKVPEKHLFCLIDYAKAFDCVDHNKLWKILKEMGIPDHPTCLLRNLYAGQEATVRTGHGTTDWFQIGKGVRQGCILSPCFFNLYAEYIMRNAGLEEAQAGI